MSAASAMHLSWSGHREARMRAQAFGAHQSRLKRGAFEHNVKSDSNSAIACTYAYVAGRGEARTLQKAWRASYTLLEPMTSRCSPVKPSCLVERKSMCMHCRMLLIVPLISRSRVVPSSVPVHMYT